MLRIDRNAQFSTEYLTLLHIDQDARINEKLQTLLQIDRSGRFYIDIDFQTLLHIDRSVEFYTELEILLHIDQDAQFNAERAGGFFSRKIYRFRYKKEEREVKSGRVWTKEQYQSLLTKQQEEPVQVLCDSESLRTWWMLQDIFYWTDVDLKEDETSWLFSEGDRSPCGISRNVHRFRCPLSERETQSGRVWTEEQFQLLLTKQREEPVRVLSDSEIATTWWMFQDEFYWANANLKEYEVRRLFSEGDRSLDGITRRNYRFHCLGERKTQFHRTYSEKEYQILLAQQQEEPVEVRTDLELDLHWYMFQDKFYHTSGDTSFDWIEMEGGFSKRYYGSWAMTFDAVKELCLEGVRNPDGISMRTYHFQCKQEGREVQSDVFWTEEQYQALLIEQQEAPVGVPADWYGFLHKNGRTWWMFQGKFYWTDEDLKRDEAKRLFAEGTRRLDGISREAIYFLQYSSGGKGELESFEVWTEEEYQALLAKQRESPVQLLTDRESGRTWWMFRDRFYWEDEDLKEIEVRALLLERIRKKKQKIERAIRLMEEDD